MAWVKNSDLLHAHDRWWDHCKPKSSKDWFAFLDSPAPLAEGNNLHDSMWEVSDTGARRINMLLGPHWETMLKALLIVEGE